MTLTRKCKYEEVHWSLSRSSLAVRCAGVSAFHFPIVGVLGYIASTTTHCTVHISVAWRRHMVAWARATYQYHVNRMDTVGRLVGWSMHIASVGLTQARPNYCTTYFKHINTL